MYGRQNEGDWGCGHRNEDGWECEYQNEDGWEYGHRNVDGWEYEHRNGDDLACEFQSDVQNENQKDDQSHRNPKEVQTLSVES